MNGIKLTFTICSLIVNPPDALYPQTHDDLKKQHDGYGADYHPSEQHPPQAGISAQTDSAAASSPTQSNGHGSGSTHKPKFMDRVKGEAKIIAGKLGGNEGKIEEGMRLKGKDV